MELREALALFELSQLALHVLKMQDSDGAERLLARTIDLVLPKGEVFEKLFFCFHKYKVT